MPTQTALPEVISLIRFSTADQIAEGKAGEEGQRSVNRAAAIHHGVTIRREMLVIDVSGRHVNDDPQFHELFEELKDPTLSGVLVAEQSRLVRPETFDDYPILAHFQRNKKLVYTPTGRIDPNTPEGRMALTVGCMMSGEELHILRGRFERGKRTKRLEGKHVGGNHMLPRTVKYIRVRNEEGKVTSAHWELVPLEVERMQRAFQLLLEGDSYEMIAERVGGGWTGKGIQYAMRNPIHIGIRRYELEAKGDEYLPKNKTGRKPKDPTKKPKKRRRLSKRETILYIPTRAELEAGTAKPIVEPIISLATWDKAQEIMAERLSHWRKSKLKNDGRERHLASSVAHCTCGLPLYPRYGSNQRSHLDRYACASRHPSGKGCGATTVKRIDLDGAIMETVVKLADVDFLMGVMEAAVEIRQAAPDPAQVAREKVLAKLANGREEMLDMVQQGDMTRVEFKKRMEKLEAEVRALTANAPAPAPEFDMEQIIALVVGVFTEFAFLANTQQRTLLRSAVKSIIVDGSARAITAVTISGGYLGAGSNSRMHSRTHSQIRSIPDITIRFPEPVVIADTFCDARCKNGHHPNSVATRWDTQRRPVQ